MKKCYALGLCLLGFSLSSAHARKKPPLTLAEREARLIMTATPQDNEVCFSPVEHCDEKLIKFLASAHKSLDIAIYDINLEHLVHHILLLSKKIPVRVLVDKGQSKGDHSLVSLLAKGGVNVRLGRQRGIMHNKFMLVDRKRLETGSFNYTRHASEANNENQLYLSTPSVIDRYRTRFETMWKESKVVEIGRAMASDE